MPCRLQKPGLRTGNGDGTVDRPDARRGPSSGAPGSGLEAGKSFEQAAIRALREEAGPHIAERTFLMTFSSGGQVRAEERFFVMRARHVAPSRTGWLPRESCQAHGAGQHSVRPI